MKFSMYLRIFDTIKVNQSINHGYQPKEGVSIKYSCRNYPGFV